jgi:hypothetical protein
MRQVPIMDSQTEGEAEANLGFSIGRPSGKRSWMTFSTDS